MNKEPYKAPVPFAGPQEVDKNIAFNFSHSRENSTGNPNDINNANHRPQSATEQPSNSSHESPTTTFSVPSVPIETFSVGNNEVPRNFRAHEHLSKEETFDQYVEEGLFESIAQGRAVLSDYNELANSLNDIQKSLYLKDQESLINDLINNNPAYVKLMTFARQYPEFEDRVHQAIRDYKNKLTVKELSTTTEIHNTNTVDNTDTDTTPTRSSNTNSSSTTPSGNRSTTNTSSTTPSGNRSTTNTTPTRSSNTNPSSDPQNGRGQAQQPNEEITQEIIIPKYESPELSEKKKIYEAAEKEYAKIIALRRFKRTMLGFGSSKQEDLSLKYQEALESYLEGSNLSDLEKVDFLAERHASLYEKVYEERQPKSKFLKKFSNWLEKTDPEKNKTIQKVKKIAAVGAITLAAGIVAGTFLPVVGTGLVGGVAGSLLIKNAAEVTVSQKLSAYRRQNEAVDKSTLNLQNPEELTTKVNQETREKVRANRKKTAVVFAGGVLMGAVGGTLAHHVLNEVKTPIKGSPLPHRAVKTHIKVKPSGVDQLSNQSVKMVDTGNAEYPWNYFAQQFGADKATPMIEKLAGLAQKAGYKINSFPEGINSIVSPNGTVYNTTQGIVSALLKFN
jgi:hypothetical protein